MSRKRKSTSSNGRKSSAVPPKLNDPELAILQVLWRKGPSTMREIQGEVGSLFSPSSVGKYLGSMTDKGMVQEEKLPYAWRYQALCSEDQVQQQLVSALTDKAFGGSRTKLVLQAFATGATSPEEITALRRLLAQDKGKKA